jgi:hypothetical protein
MCVPDISALKRHATEQKQQQQQQQHSLSQN